MRRRTTAALLLAALLAAPASAASYAERVQQTVLGNGMKLILLEDHKAPVAVLQVWYRVGARNEVAGQTGLSHLLEHMMFKGTKKTGPEEYTRIVQRNGGQSNAFTTADYTTYFATIASDRLEVVAELEADRMANLNINDALFRPERDVVMEERRLRVENNPVSMLFEQLGATAYTVHPYRNPVIGWMNDIGRTRLDDLLRHYRTYYAPNNAFVVAVGDFDAAQLARRLGELFGGIPAGPRVPEVRAVEPPQAGERRLVLKREAELPYVAAAYHVPNLDSADAAALDVLAAVLAGGESARLHRELVYRRRLATHAGADYDYNSRDAGLFRLYAQPLPGRPAAAVERALFAEIERIQLAPPSERELEKARNGAEAEFVFAQDSLFYQALLLGQYEICGDWRRIDGYLPAVRAVSAADISRVALAYLHEDNRTVATLVPLPTGDGRPRPAMPPTGPLH